MVEIEIHTLLVSILPHTDSNNLKAELIGSTSCSDLPLTIMRRLFKTFSYSSNTIEHDKLHWSFPQVNEHNFKYLLRNYLLAAQSEVGSGDISSLDLCCELEG
jgi:hypothetical protein